VISAEIETSVVPVLKKVRLVLLRVDAGSVDIGVEADREGPVTPPRSEIERLPLNLAIRLNGCLSVEMVLEPEGVLVQAAFRVLVPLGVRG
jgi:hypothetical protein